MVQGQGEPSPDAHYPTPGLTLLGTLPQGPVRCIRQCTTGAIYAIAGDGVYLLDPNAWTGSLLGNITALRPYPASMMDNGVSMFIVDGTPYGGWTIDLASNTFAPVNDPTGLFVGADKVDFLDTYFLFNSPGTPQFYSSLSLSTSFDTYAQDFADKESFSDLLVTLCVSRREIWLLGDRTTEIWYDAGASSTADYQFQEIPGVFVDHGCAAKYSVAEYDNSLFWLSKNRTGQGFVLEGAGYATKRISTFAIENTIAEYSRIDDAIGFMYTLLGHTCYVLTFPTADHTWVYDVTAGQWHEWAWLDANGAEHRHRANCCYPCNGKIVIGDWQNGNLYELDPNVYTDNGSPIKRQRSYPHLLNNGARVFYREFLADIETGNAPIASPTTITTTTPTWPPLIAQDIGGPGGNPIYAIDWPRNVVYFAIHNEYLSYNLQLATQAAPLNSAAISQTPSVLAVDPLTGDLLVQPNVSNGSPIFKLDSTTFATIGTFGNYASFPPPSYPHSMWVGQQVVCVVCNGFSYGFLKESEFSGAVGAFRVDTMTQAGFYQSIVSGSVDSRGIMCAGVSGSVATVFLTLQALQYSTSLPLYVITVRAGAETYDPTTWPATNPDISWATVGNVATTAIDPSQVAMLCGSIGCDLADGNALMWVGTGPTAGTVGSIVNYWLAKVRATDAAVLWAIQFPSDVKPNLAASRINGSLWLFDNSTSWQVDTVLGTVVSQRFRGVSVGTGGAAADSEQQLAYYNGSYSGGVTYSPIPADSGTVNGSGWYLMGGEITNTIVTGGADVTNRIWLDWSDDRGHSFGNPVCQSFGARGRYIASLQWQRLGYARDRVFRLTWSEPLATALQGAWIDLDANAKT